MLYNAIDVKSQEAVHPDKAQTSGCRGLWEGKWGGINRFVVFFLVNEKVFKLEKHNSGASKSDTVK